MARKLARLQDAGAQRDHEPLRTVYERMLERGPERFQVKPSGLPDMAALYEQLPNFTEVLDDVRRQVALAQGSSDGLEVTPMLLLGPPGIGKSDIVRSVAADMKIELRDVRLSMLDPVDLRGFPVVSGTGKTKNECHAVWKTTTHSAAMMRIS